MMMWSPTPHRTAVGALAALWWRPEWRESSDAPKIRERLLLAIEHADEVVRFSAAHVACLLQADDDASIAFLHRRLGVERHPEVAANLLAQLNRYRDSAPQSLDDIISDIVNAEPWKTALVCVDHDRERAETVRILCRLVVFLRIRHQQPKATELVNLWMADQETGASRQAIMDLRAWIELGHDRVAERDRAFRHLIDAARAAQSRRTADRSDVLAHHRANNIADVLYFSSGAYAKPGETPQRPTAGYAPLAFAAIQHLVGFAHPAIVHHLVETLAHLAPDDPPTAFHLLHEAVMSGSAYTRDQLAADLVVKTIRYYISEYRSILASDQQLLSNVHNVLRVFVNAGWPEAVMLAYTLSDTFR